ncbi:hypothetical protein DPMN_158287 [Dreissena polymorpha]|uniref:Uncharacterized protein n=1 Tax=Dreissena polymorpha TaxID=45954 RepID=A0A9D4IPM9_DREPO|nr:hypothetical protein DPMN_158287 [Dreissena polymorpha]
MKPASGTNMAEVCRAGVRSCPAVRERGTGVWFHCDVPGTDKRVRRQEVRGRTNSGRVSVT